MTIDEAKRIIKIVLVIAEEFEITVQGEEFTKEKCKEAVEIVTKALEQEPCDDCIRREDALMALTGEYTDSLSEILPKAIKRINALPPVNPAEKQEPCTDAISREELLKAIDTWDKFGYTETGCFVREPKGDYVPYIHYDDVIKSIKGMPPVTPQYTDAEIQKMQELEQAEIQKAYELGKAEMQPCEDAISRQAALEAIRKCHCEEWVKADIGASIEALQPIIFAEKVGRWKRISMDKYVQHAMAFYRCSECGKDIIGEHNYCPNCGCRMQEVEE